jgi:hypothetical protein
MSEETRPNETTTGKHGKSYQDLQEDDWTGDHEANCWITCWITKDQGLDIVEGSAPSETGEPTRSNSVRRAGNVGAPAVWDSFNPSFEKKNFG